MFAKLSAFALCLSLVSALQINVQAEVLELATVAVGLSVASGDPTHVGLYLKGVSTTDIYPLINDVDLSLAVDVNVNVPLVQHPNSQYQVIAVKVGDDTAVYAHSGDITVKAKVA